MICPDLNFAALLSNGVSAGNCVENVSFSCHTACLALATDICFDKYVHQLAPFSPAGTLGSWLNLQKGKEACEELLEWSIDSINSCAVTEELFLRREEDLLIPQLCDARCSWPDSLPSIFFDTYGPGSAEHKEIWCSRRLGTASPPQFCQTAVTNAQNEMELCTVLGDGCTAWYREASLAKARRECTRTRATPSSCGERALTEYNALITRCTAAFWRNYAVAKRTRANAFISVARCFYIAAAASVFDTPHKPTFCDYAKRVVLRRRQWRQKERVGDGTRVLTIRKRWAAITP